MTCCRMVGYVGTDRERLRCAMRGKATLLKVCAGQGYGVAHYTDDALLLNRRPRVDVTAHPFEELLGGVQTRVLVAHAYAGVEHPVDSRDLHPFKFRHWAFALTGGLPVHLKQSEIIRRALIAELPDFIGRDIQGASCSEALFHHFLGRVHQAGQLDNLNKDSHAVSRALRDSVDRFQALAAEQNVATPILVNTLLTDGQRLYFLKRGGLAAYELQEGLVDCPVCYGEQGGGDSFSLRESHQRFRCLFLAVELDAVPAGWHLIEEDAVLIADTAIEIAIL